LAMLEPLGVRGIFRPGEMVFKTGPRDGGVTGVFRGAAEVFESRDGQEQILGTFGPATLLEMWLRSWARRQWPAFGAGRKRARSCKCLPNDCGRRWRNCPE